MELEITKLGERGQVVIPQDIRNQLHLKKGEKFLVVRSDSKIIFEPLRKLKAKIVDELKEDIIDMKLAEKGIKEIEKGEYVIQTEEEFIKEMEEWVKE